MPYSRSIVSVALAALMFASGVQARPQDAAAGQESGGAPSFSDIANGKKLLRRGDIPKDNEALKELRAHLSDYDADHNGGIDEKEYSAYIHKSDTQQHR